MNSYKFLYKLFTTNLTNDRQPVNNQSRNGWQIIIAALIMRTFPSGADVQGTTYYYYPCRWIQFQDRTYSAQFPVPREHRKFNENYLF